MFTERNRKVNRLTLKCILFLITYMIALIWVMLHPNEMFGTVSMIIDILRPFIYNIIIAFVLSIPMKFFLRKLPDNLGRWKEAPAAVYSLLIISGILAFAIHIMMPQMIESIVLLTSSLPGYIKNAQKMITSMIERQQIPRDISEQMDTHSTQLRNALVNLLKNEIPHLLTAASDLTDGLASVFMMLVIAVYLTVSKDKPLEQSRRFLYAFTSSGVNAFVLQVVHPTDTAFSAFIIGQLVETVIIGVLYYIGYLVLGFPYTPILNVITGYTNIVPIFGAILGVVLCALLVALVNPPRRVFLVILDIYLQQLESSLIYPCVTGTSVGLSGFWVLFTIIIGNGPFGFVGMLLGLSTFFVVYSLLCEGMNCRVHLERENNSVELPVSKNLPEQSEDMI